jgi:hypothetical protein
MVDAAGDAKRRGSFDRMRDYGRAPLLSLAQHADKPPAISNCRARPPVHENALGNLEMAVSLASLHFQHVGWK